VQRSSARQWQCVVEGELMEAHMSKLHIWPRPQGELQKFETSLWHPFSYLCLKTLVDLPTLTPPCLTGSLSHLVGAIVPHQFLHCWIWPIFCTWNSSRGWCGGQRNCKRIPPTLRHQRNIIFRRGIVVSVSLCSFRSH
jgi:hypothetical protein